MTSRLAQISRHPIKSHGRERLDQVTLTEGQSLPWDRHWAVAHDGATLKPGWNPCAAFMIGSRAPGLMSISARLDESTKSVTLSAPGKTDLIFSPDDAEDFPRFLAWVQDLLPQNRAQPAQIVSAGRGMTDTDYPSISILNLASGAALAREMDADLAPERWRANLWLEGLDPWVEREWIGRQIRIGSVVLEVTEHIVRCKATTANPSTGVIDADTLAGLRVHGHQEMGLYARVVQGGAMARGDAVVLV